MTDGAAETVTVAFPFADPPAPEQVTVYVVVVEGETVTEPPVPVAVNPDPEHEVAFDDDHVSVELPPAVIAVGFAERLAVGFATAEATTAVHAPQLLFSFDSVIVPVDALELLSAQARTYHVAAKGKVYESAAGVFELAASVVALCVPMSVALVPDASVARWKRLVKPAPVDAEPVFEIVEESVTAVPAVADVGETEPAVRSMVAAAEIVTVLDMVFEVMGGSRLRQVTVYVVVTVGFTIREPNISPLPSVPVPEQVSAFVEFQSKETAPPDETVLGVAVNVVLTGPSALASVTKMSPSTNTSAPIVLFFIEP